MTDRTITLPLRRWHKLLKAMGEVRPGLTTDATFCDKATNLIESEITGLCHLEPFAITRPEDSWRNLCNFCLRYGIHHRDIYQQLLGVKVEWKPVPVDPDELDECRKMLAMDDDEFEAATRPHVETKKEQPTLF